MSKYGTFILSVSASFIFLGLTACLDLEPNTAVNPIGSDHTVFLTFESGGEPIEGAPIEFIILSGPNEGMTSQPNIGECVPNSCTTDTMGQVSWTYSSELPGTDIIIASTTFTNDEDEETTIQSDAVEKIWTAPIPTLGQWGLIAMAGVLGITGLIIFKRRKAAI